MNLNNFMRRCSICGKGYLKSTKRSHSMRATTIRLYPNLQWLKLPHGQRIKACTKCMRTYNKKMVAIAA